MIAGFPKEGRLEQDGTGHYADVVHAVLAETDTEAKFVIMPVLRAVRTFADGGSICLLPAAFERWKHKFPYLTREDIIESEPIDYVTAHIVTRPGDPAIVKLDELEGKRISVWVGLTIDAFLSDIDVEIIRAESEESSIKLLMSGRVDAIWNWVPDAYILYERLGYGTPNLVESEPIFGAAAHFLCRRTPATEALMSDIDPAIRMMRKDGRLKDIMGQHTRVVGVDVPLNMAETNR
ncbi:substrate-binding periplasmic protein [Kordiimonas lacus]|uniref:Extracellular solute-binding protein, family 3 n=1 Tax=Kordiimonas lacus TaxID=637679 RepID=A0A1G7BC67_9PROT|nr:transporter substrate-binding domain-containing protein [Kordiimonas lacus]SDE24507.1 extracellular solute-binding protein, family 3 [Kordiimonas lacus]